MILLFLAVFFVIILLYFQRKFRKNLLPGPTGLPLLGNALQIGFQPHLRFMQWAKIYGPIFRIKLGLKEAIVINDHKLMKELFSKTASTGRMTDNPAVHEYAKGPHGILNAVGQTWEQQRKFTVRTLRNFGFSKTSMETMIMDEVKTMLTWFTKNEATPISGLRLFNAPVINSLWRIVTGERCQWEGDTKPPILIRSDEFFEASMKITTNGVFFAPVLRLIAPEYFGWNRYLQSINAMHKLVDESIKAHKETFNPHDLRDFVDHFLSEINNETDSQSSFYKEKGYTNMVAGVFDLFIAGSETSSNLLSWSLLYLSEYQKVQENFQKEIDHVVGSRTPSLYDRNSMPYTKAIVSEISRIVSVTPVGIPHQMESDLMFHDYFLPKGATVFSNIYGIHRNPDVWGDPDNFRPERFLIEDDDDDGNCEIKLLHHDALVPFSYGKRRCIGETLAEDTLFLFLTTIFQQFNILPDPATQGKQDFEADLGLILAPKPFKIVLHSRKK